MPANFERPPVGNIRSHVRHTRGAPSIVTLLSASTLFAVVACAPSPAQNQPGAAAALTVPMATAAAQEASVVGDVTVTSFRHASLQLEYAGKVIHIDPTSESDYSSSKPADLILVTHSHKDHYDPKAIVRLRKEGAPVVGPAEVAKKFKGMTTISNGQSMSFAGVPVEAVPMYNPPKGPSARYHKKGDWNGYVLTLGTSRVYVAGDTGCTDEMRALKNIDIAFVPMNLPYTMPPSEAARCVKAFKPRVVYPYHYLNPDTGVYQNREEFKAALAGEPVEVRLVDWYPSKPAGGVNR